MVTHTSNVIINNTITIPTRRSATATLRVKYFSYTNSSEVHVYIIVNGNRKPNENKIGQTSHLPTLVTLPVFTHNVTVSGTEAAISIFINSTSDLSHYDIIISNDKGEHVLRVEVVLKGKSNVLTYQ